MTNPVRGLGMNRGRWSSALAGGWRQVLFDVLLLACVVWVTRFWHSPAFGLYEDDYTKIPWAMSTTWGELWHQIGEYSRTLGDNAKPLHAALIFLFSYAGNRLGGLWGAYLLGFSIVAANCVLFYFLLRRISGRRVAVIGGLAFALFPADTTQALLTHGFGLQCSLAFLLLALHAYLGGQRLIAYLMAFLILITYETPYPVFLAAPLLLHPWDRRWIRRSLGHALVMAGMLVAVFLVRRLVGEGRVFDLEIVSAIRITIMHMAFGPLATIGMFPYRALQALLGLDGETATAILLSFSLLAGVLSQIGAPPVEGVGLSVSWVKSLDVRSVFISVSARKAWATAVATRLEEGWLWIAGGEMLVLAYPLTYTLSAWESAGRATRVHMAAIVGASILFACVVSTLLQRSRTGRSRGWVRAGAAGILALLLGFGFVVQKDYVRSWVEQRSFWVQVVRLGPDVQEGTVVLVDPTGLQDTTQIGANTWNLPRILDQVYAFPEGWPEPPRVFRLVPGWQDAIVTEDGRFRLDATTVSAPPSLYRAVDSTSVILLTSANGQLARQPGPLLIGDDAFGLQSPAAELQRQLAPGPLYALLIEGRGP